MENLVSIRASQNGSQNAGDEPVLVVSSVQVAKHMDKLHKNVMRDIREILDALDTPDEEDGSVAPQIYADHLKEAITVSEYVDERGKTQECFLLTEDGFYSLIRTYRNKEAKRLYQTLTGEFFNAKKELKRLKDKRLAEMKSELSRLHYESQDGTFHTLREERDRFKVERDVAERRLWEIEQNPIEKYSKSVQDRTFQLAEEKARKLYAPALKEVYKEMVAVYEIGNELAMYIAEVGAKPLDEWVDKPDGHLRRRAAQLMNRRVKCELRGHVRPEDVAAGMRRWLEEPCDIVVAE